MRRREKQLEMLEISVSAKSNMGYYNRFWV